ncbi:MAG: methyl-accepting chemotaxis protein [Clostridiales bacterium]|nr:methyl-accepting chemotaxis protein [Clostridiales bacterium]
MSVKKKLGLIIALAIAIMVGCLILQNMSQQAKVTKGLDETVLSFSQKSQEDIEYTLIDLSKGIAEYMTSLEASIDASMLNAAYQLQESYAHNPKLSTDELKAIASKTGMTDLQITNVNGDFILATDSAALSINLFDIWDGYRDLLKNPNLVLATDLKISVQSGNIFKYTAIPRRDQKGCLEVGLNSDHIKESLQEFTEGTKGFASLIVVDNENTVLIAIGENAGNADYVEGTQTEDGKFKEVFTSGKEVTLQEDAKSSIYYPVSRGDGVNYVLKLTVDNAPYFENVKILSSQTFGLTQELRTSLKLGVGVNLLILVTMGMIMIALMNQIMKPIVNMSKVAGKIVDGDLNVSVNEKQGGEVGTLIKAFNSMVLDLKDMISNIKQTSNTIKESSSTIQVSLEAVTGSSNDISSATEEISHGAYDLAKENSQVYENTNELSSHLDSMIVNVESVNTNIESMEQINREGIETLGNLEGHFKDSIHALNEVEDKIEALQEKSTSIRLIVDTIGGIATQTNLLALNASIEAARAGEQGKGFAVVAEEVRKLAESSTHQTQEIAQIIREIISIVESTTQKMGVTRTSIARTSDALSTTKDMFEKLSDSTEEVGKNSYVIIQSIEYVSHAKNALLSLVENISAISQEAAASSKEVSEATIRQEKELHDVMKQINKMDTIVDVLNDFVQKYNVD